MILAGLVLVSLVLGSIVVVTDPKPATLPGRAVQWITTPRPTAAVIVDPPMTEPDVPPFSDVDFDDSGYGPAFAFSGPITDPNSLTQMRDSVLGRNRRGIKVLEGKIALLSPGDPAAPHLTAQWNLLIGVRWMYEGNGTFRDVAPDPGVTEPLASFACWFWDYDNDGRLDLWVNPNGASLSDVVRDQLGQPTRGERPRLFRRNVGGGKPFQDVTADVGLDRVVLPKGSSFGDVDNDGFLDIYLGTGWPSNSYLMPNVLFRNKAGRHFTDITAATGTGHLQKGDGDIDSFIEAGGAAPGREDPGCHHHLADQPDAADVS